MAGFYEKGNELSTFLKFCIEATENSPMDRYPSHLLRAVTFPFKWHSVYSPLVSSHFVHRDFGSGNLRYQQVLWVSCRPET
jgi:hypothetical protein